jgi:4'-phosphopantetheinyl transferase
VVKNRELKLGIRQRKLRGPNYWDTVFPEVYLQKDQVDVWSVPLELEEASLHSFEYFLSQDERRKAQRFRVETAREHFIATRSFLRLIMGRYLEVKPERLQFQYGPHGKPALADEFGETGICFNVSHSHGLALFAVTLGRAVGVDIEKIRPDLDCVALAKRFFSPYEIKALRSLPVDQQRRAFFNGWTRKEAYLKARGEGLSTPLDQFDISLIPGKPAALLGHRSDPKEVFKWSIEDLDLGPEYSAALAVERQSCMEIGKGLRAKGERLCVRPV